MATSACHLQVEIIFLEMLYFMKQLFLLLITQILSLFLHLPNRAPLPNHSLYRVILPFSLQLLFQSPILNLSLLICVLLIILFHSHFHPHLINFHPLLLLLTLTIHLIVETCSLPLTSPTLACIYVPSGPSPVVVASVPVQEYDPAIFPPSLSSSPKSTPMCRYVPYVCDSSLIPFSSILDSSTDVPYLLLKNPKPAPVNVEPMHTITKTYIQSLTISSDDLIHRGPTYITEALLSPQRTLAVKEELSALSDNNTWPIAPLHSGRIPIECKWLFRVKRNANGDIARYKARPVAKGFSQKLGFDFQETSSPVIKSTIVHIILSLVLTHKWYMRQVDINNAFLHGDLVEEVYMVHPPGFEHISEYSHLTCKLQKALYGLKKASCAWFEKLKSFLHTNLGFKVSIVDSCLFIKFDNDFFVLLLVFVQWLMMLLYPLMLSSS